MIDLKTYHSQQVFRIKKEEFTMTKAIYKHNNYFYEVKQFEKINLLLWTDSD